MAERTAPLLPLTIATDELAVSYPQDVPASWLAVAGHLLDAAVNKPVFVVGEAR